jgi:hypothetical protein
MHRINAYRAEKKNSGTYTGMRRDNRFCEWVFCIFLYAFSLNDETVRKGNEGRVGLTLDDDGGLKQKKK